MSSLLRNLSKRLYRITNIRTLGLSAAALALVLVLLKVLNTPFGVMRIKKVSGGVRILDMQGFYGPDQAYATLVALGEAGRDAYMNFLVFGDVLLPLAYGAFLTIALGLGIRGLLGNPAHPLRHINLLPLVAVALDLLENLALAGLLLTFPERVDGIATTAGILTLAKRMVLITCLWGSGAALVTGGVATILQRRKKAT